MYKTRELQQIPQMNRKTLTSDAVWRLVNKRSVSTNGKLLDPWLRFSFDRINTAGIV